MRGLYDDFTNLYSVSKTLRFELIPQGETKDNIEKEGLIEEDFIRSDNYKKVKSYQKEILNKLNQY